MYLKFKNVIVSFCYILLNIEILYVLFLVSINIKLN